MKNPSGGQQKSSLILRIWKVFRWILLGLAVLAIVVYFGVGTMAAMQLTAPTRNFDPANNPSQFGLKYDEVSYQSRGDQTLIKGWYIPSATNTKAVILVHGRNDSRTFAFKGLFVEFANSLHQAGYSVLMIDLRGHGQSGDGRFTFGIKERWDVEAGVDWLMAHGYQPGSIAAFGYSLGAGSIIEAAAEDTDIGAVISEAGFADIKPTIENMWASQSGLPQLFLQPTIWMTRLLYGYDIYASRPMEVIGKISPRPILLIHCTTDNAIDYSNLAQLSDAAPWAQTWSIAGCEHGYAYNFNPADYTEHVIQFLDANLKTE